MPIFATNRSPCDELRSRCGQQPQYIGREAHRGQRAFTAINAQPSQPLAWHPLAQRPRSHALSSPTASSLLYLQACVALAAGCRVDGFVHPRGAGIAPRPCPPPIFTTSIPWRCFHSRSLHRGRRRQLDSATDSSSASCLPQQGFYTNASGERTATRWAGSGWASGSRATNEFGFVRSDQLNVDIACSWLRSSTSARDREEIIDAPFVAATAASVAMINRRFADVNVSVRKGFH